MANKTLVIAGSHQQFKHFIEEMGLNPNDPKIPYIYIHSPDQAMGYEARDLIKIGTYYHRPDHHLLEEVCKSRIRPFAT